MRALAILLLLLLCSCSTMRRVGAGICRAKDQTCTALDLVAAPFGLPGTAVAGLVKAGLEAACAVVDAALNMPADVAEDVGITTQPITTSSRPHEEKPKQ